MTEGIIIALISAGLPTLATSITAFLQYRRSNRHDAKRSIFQLILEDRMSVQEGKLPTNYQNVLKEFDLYHKSGGNSYVEEKVNDYKKWFIQMQEKMAKPPKV